MKPLFTVHAGEYLVGSHVEQTFRRVHVWVPSRDAGVDLLVSDRLNRRAVSLQVKFSKDWLPHMLAVFQKELRACGWWTMIEISFGIRQLSIGCSSSMGSQGGQMISSSFHVRS